MSDLRFKRELFAWPRFCVCWKVHRDTDTVDQARARCSRNAKQHLLTYGTQLLEEEVHIPDERLAEYICLRNRRIRARKVNRPALGMSIYFPPNIDLFYSFSAPGHR